MVVAKVLERIVEVLGLGLGVSYKVDLRKLSVLVLLALESLGLVVLSLAWVLPLGVIVLGLAILLGLGVLEFRSLLALEDCFVFRYSLVLVLVFLLHYWIRILRSLRPGLGL